MGEYWQNGEKKYTWGVNDSMHPDFHRHQQINRPEPAPMPKPAAWWGTPPPRPVYRPLAYPGGTPARSSSRGGAGVLLVVLIVFLLPLGVALIQMVWVALHPQIASASGVVIRGRTFLEHCSSYWRTRHAYAARGLWLPKPNHIALRCPRAMIHPFRRHWR